ncbi:magnesium transporter [Rhodospirillum rubrum]|uniref:Magnesium transporter MgtE n=1 Tax=Rhodospirillum rubrum (strain ATCC 11170 / ATH 1.1.1 / DSM 467 / LMG 4362 / NCIMB 8255 / S1) TaxID=269796 RepID=Q2RSV0_RHORT|nr:magnesium transporter [Rhodospirillum rubrum]ABC22795.1 Divalent cation transporter [Rhodospirillum rubrum ATCC 11170]AEO48516.1 divalent cation transporter [Rhodospirillum rubrum F11]MBK5954392.1 magnesium transporter [Rhodospirillum rubrum]QXG78784.1 magnesium transporter [Rhodospirillum rubrum]HCF16654.1 magnesium transporter [Rhodospirillum rubrum]
MAGLGDREKTGDRDKTQDDAAPAEDGFGLSRDQIEAVRAALDDEEAARGAETARALVLRLHYADQADLVQSLPAEDRRALIGALKGAFDPEILPELDDYVRDEVIETLGYQDLAQALAELDSDDALYVVAQLDEAEQAAVLERLPVATRALIEQGLSLPEYSAGRLMQRELVAVPAYWSVGETLDYLRSAPRLPEDFHEIYVVDPRHRPVGQLRLSTLLRSQRSIRLRDIMDAEMPPLSTTADQGEVARLFRDRNLMSAPVIDVSGRLVGRITVDDVLDVIEEEAEDDMLRLAGVAEVDLYRAVVDTVKARASWLGVNLITAILASLVIGLFEATLQSIVALAVLMPIVASMGGNAGTQALTVAVRSLATKELTPSNAWRIIGKEFLVGILNGVVFAVLIGAIAWIWFDRPEIGLIIAAAMVINLAVAGLSGIVIPLALERMRIDPAIASAVFLTTITDVVGFFAFLGLASLFLMP